MINQWFSKIIKPPPPASSPKSTLPLPGLYAYTRLDSSEKMTLHLRVDDDGRGTLVLNANRIFHLNPTASSMTYLILEDIPQTEALKKIQKAYNGNRKQIEQDYLNFRAMIQALIEPQAVCPICDLDINVNSPISAEPSAPYRMDLALTYSCNNHCLHCYNESGRHPQSLSLDQWKKVIDRLWELRIPHIVFTGGEPTLSPFLPQLITYAHAKGFICGLNTNGRRLSEQTYLNSLIAAGLDHVQITLESHDSLIHDNIVQNRGAWQETTAGLRLALQSPLYVMTNTTLLRQNTPSLQETLLFLAKLGVPTIGLNALIFAGRGKEIQNPLAETELESLLTIAKQITQDHQQRLIWYTPTRYCHFDPVEQNLGIKGCTAALYNMCIEPNGNVLPCQSYLQPVGNILTNQWEEIWQHDLCQWLRQRRFAPQECRDCPLLIECGAGCPLALDR